MTRALALLAVLATPVAAQTYVPPVGCEVIMTVQGRSCTVRQVMSCADNPQGFDVDLLGPNGPIGQTRFDAGTMPVVALGPGGGPMLTTIAAADPFDAAAAMRTGIDTFDLEVERGTDGVHLRLQGEIRTEGAARVVAGREVQPLVVTRTQTDMATGDEVRQTAVMLFDLALGVGFNAASRDIDPPGPELDLTPMGFALPGDKGFLSMEPRHDCLP